MHIKNSYSGFVFTGNPIIVSSDSQDKAIIGNGVGTLSVVIDGTTVYESRTSCPFSINISEILDSYIPYFPEINAENRNPIVEVRDNAELCEQTAVIYVENSEGDRSDEIEITAIRGGVSKQNLRALISDGTDIFSTRFFNLNTNIFMTTRIAERLIILKETELSPLYFLTNKNQSVIKVKECVSGITWTGELFRGVHALDIEALRYYFFNNHNVLASIFDVSIDGCDSCRLVIERAGNELERHRLRFRNSLGVFEIMEISGMLSVVQNNDDESDNIFVKYDSDIDDFYKQRNRIELKTTLEITSFSRPRREMPFLLDMLSSDEVYLLDYADHPVRVIQSINDLNYMLRPTNPEKFTLSLELTEQDFHCMPDISIKRQGIFSEIFSEQFN